MPNDTNSKKSLKNKDFCVCAFAFIINTHIDDLTMLINLENRWFQCSYTDSW